MNMPADTFDIEIVAPAPINNENAPGIKESFERIARAYGAIQTYVLENNGRCVFHAEFVNCENAAQFARQVTFGGKIPIRPIPKPAGRVQ